MPFDWTLFLAVAKTLQIKADFGVLPEANHRSAVGRAYYAAYGHALHYSIEKLGFARTKSSDDHANLRKHLIDHRHLGVAKRLDTLRQRRNSADYEEDLGHSNFKSAFAGSRKAAEEVIQLCKLSASSGSGS